MNLRVYYDKAGPTKIIPAATVAGLISTDDGWTQFDEEWSAALADFDIPFFHMSDYDSGRGIYADWKSSGLKEARLDRLLGIIERYVLAVVGATVAVADCDAWSDELPLESAYRLTASHCFNVVPQYRYLREHPQATVVHVFEQGDQGHGKLLRVYADMYGSAWRRAFNRLTTDVHVGDKKVPALQAADMLAFEGWKHWAREVGGDGRRPRYPWVRLSKSLVIWSGRHYGS